METIVLVVLMGVMNLLAFLIGARVGQKVQKGEDIKLPTINPIQIIETHKEKREIEKEKEVARTNWDNINNYDGSGLGQKDV